MSGAIVEKIPGFIAIKGVVMARDEDPWAGGTPAAILGKIGQGEGEKGVVVGRRRWGWLFVIAVISLGFMERVKGEENTGDEKKRS